MAKINVNTDFDIDISGTSFVDDGSKVANILAPDVVDFLAQQGRKMFVNRRLEGARTESKSLLEEFTSSDKMLDLAEKESGVLRREQAAFERLQVPGEDPAEHNLTKSEIMSLQTQKENIERDRRAVVQGFMTSDEYRLRAEKLFYQQVAITPGIRQELAQVMGEFLGVDPRGQTAKITMAARDAMVGKKNTAKNKIETELIKAKLYDPNISLDANITQHWGTLQRQFEGVRSLAQLNSQLSTQTNIDSSTMAAYAKRARFLIPEAEPQVLRNMATFGNTSVYDFSPEDVVQMDDGLRAQYLNHIESSFTEAMTVLNNVQLKTGQDFSTNMNTLTAHRDLLVSIMSSNKLNDVLKNNQSIAKTRNDLVVEGAKAGIFISQPDAVFLAAFNDIVSGSALLAQNATAGTILLEGLQGVRANLSTLSRTDKSATLKQYSKILQDVTKSYSDDPKKWDDTQVQNMGNVANMIATHETQDLNNQNKMQLINLVGQPGFIKRLAEVNPEQATILKRDTAKHQDSLARSFREELNGVVSDNRAKLSPLDFHLSSESKAIGWEIVINTQAMDKLIPQRLGIPSVPGQQKSLSAALDKKDKQVVEGLANKIEVALNRTTDLINNLVKSKAQVMNISEARAAKIVAQDMGIALSDSEEAQAVPGFSEESGAKIIEPPEVTPVDANVAAMLEIAEKTGASFEEIKAFIEATGVPVGSIEDHVDLTNGN